MDATKDKRNEAGSQNQRSANEHIHLPPSSNAQKNVAGALYCRTELTIRSQLCKLASIGEEVAIPDRRFSQLDLLLETEVLCKTTGIPAEAICGRTLFGIAAMSRAR